MAYDQYNDDIDYNENYAEQNHDLHVPKHVANDPDWKAVSKLFECSDFCGALDHGIRFHTVAEMLTDCEQVVLPKYEAELKSSPRNARLAKDITALVGAIRYIKTHAPYLITAENDSEMRQAGAAAQLEFYQKLRARWDQTREAARSRLAGHSGSLLLSPWLLGKDEWQIKHAAKRVVIKNMSSMHYLMILVSHAGTGKWITASEIKAAKGEIAVGWNSQSIADSRYVRELKSAGLEDDLKSVSAMGPHTRVFSDQENLAHDAIRKGLDRAIEAITKADSELGEHIARHVVRDGHQFSFTDKESNWAVG